MKAVKVELSRPDHINTLVNITNQYPYPILLREGRYLVDAKSVMGICSLHRAKPVMLEIYSDDCLALMNELKPLLT